MLKLLYIGLGGFFGAISRYSISKLLNTKWKSIIPFGTLAVNILGSFLIGLLMAFFLEKNVVQPYLRAALTTGFLGALTTFSTFGYETMQLLEDKSYIFAGVNIFSNLLFSILFVFLGIYLARLI